jgi:hypothetical protein
VPRCAIFIKGTDNIAELNDVHHTVLETCDMGAIRMVQRNARLRGNVIRFNRVTDTPGYGFHWQTPVKFESPFFTWGIYLDDYTCGTTVFGNIVARASRGGVMVHGGGDNLVVNNILDNAGMYGIEFAPMEANYGNFPHVYRGNRAERNILITTNEGYSPYRIMTRVADLPAMAENLVWSGGRTPAVIQNLLPIPWADWLRRGLDQQTVVVNEGKPAGCPDRPEACIPANWKVSFRPIPVDEMGCFQSPERASWPIAPNYDRVRESPVLHRLAVE